MALSRYILFALSYHTTAVPNVRTGGYYCFITIQTEDEFGISPLAEFQLL